MKVILNALQTASLKARQPINSIAGGVGKVSPAVAATVHATLERVFDDCQQVMPVHRLQTLANRFDVCDQTSLAMDAITSSRYTSDVCSMHVCACSLSARCSVCISLLLHGQHPAVNRIQIAKSYTCVSVGCWIDTTLNAKVSSDAGAAKPSPDIQTAG